MSEVIPHQIQLVNLSRATLVSAGQCPDGRWNVLVFFENTSITLADGLTEVATRSLMADIAQSMKQQGQAVWEWQELPKRRKREREERR